MPLSKQEQEVLLRLARDTITAHLSGRPLPSLPSAKGELGQECGAFVTLHKKGNLRGCIGHMVSRGPLIKTVREMAIASATEDSRFPVVKLGELNEIDIEISVLSPMKTITDVNEIQIGTHGVVMSHGWRKGVFLPQVAPEQGWNREELLVNLCHKAGLPPNAWKDPKTVIEIFTAQVFGEHQPL